MQVLGIIPARGGSKRVPRKNVRSLQGKPLVAWTIEAGLAARRIARLVVSSDDPEVLEIARKHGSDLALERPAELAADGSPSIDFVHHALQILEREGKYRFDAVAILQPSSPLTLPIDIDATIGLLESSGAECAVSVMKLEDAPHPAKFKVFEGNRLRPYLEAERGRMSSQELPDVYVRNGAVYATRRAAIDRGEIVCEDCAGYLMPRERSVDINYEIDWQFLEFLLSRSVSHRDDM
jgi:CMP-N-acetylneuraminic acid synthetase